MPSYHSSFHGGYQKACDLSLIAFENKGKPNLDGKLIKAKDKSIDIIDEAIAFFRANVLFKSFSIKTDGDKTLVYLEVFIAKILSSIENVYTDKKKSKELMYNLISECEWGPNVKNHFLNTILEIKQNEVAELSSYLKSIREETVNRMFYLLFEAPGCTLDIKYWMAYSRKSFLGYKMPQVKKFN